MGGLRFQEGVQEGLVALLCYRKEAGAEVALIIEPRDLDPVYRDIAELAIAHRHRFSEAPGEHTLDLFETAKERNASRAAHFDALFDSIQQTEKHLSAEFLLDRACAFVRYQRFKEGMRLALQELSKDTEESLAAAEARIREAMDKTVHAFDPGIHFAHDLDESTRFLEDPEESFPTGIPAFDDRGLGPVRGRLHMFVAPSGKGKSWWLLHLAAEAWKWGVPTLYVTLEMSKDEASQRLTQRMGSFLKRAQSEGVEWEEFIDTKELADAGTRTKTRRMRDRPSFDEGDAVAKVRRKLRAVASQGNIRIKEFPNGALSVSHLDDYLTALADRERFMPQLLLVDYADIMRKSPGMDRWEALIEISEGLRRIAQTRHIAVATVSQTKQSGAKAKRVDVEHMAGAWDKVATADTVITYSRTDEEERRGLARLWVAKSRNEEGRFGVLISQAYSVGQFVMDSVRMGSNYFSDGGDD